MNSLDAARAAIRRTDRTLFETMAGNAPASRRAARWGRAFARPSDVDRHVGARIRMRRILLGLTQHQLARRIGVTYQQQHKYEQGSNRISAGRLFAIARALEVDVDDFFVGLEEPAADRQDLTLALIRSVIEIREKRHRDAVCLLARMLADQDLAQRPRARRRG
jgi:transcriptional regulator with XRE-family HTH domain